MREKVGAMMQYKEYLDGLNRENKYLSSQAGRLSQLEIGYDRWTKNSESTFNKVDKEGRIAYAKRSFEKDRFTKTLSE
jgi:hypothetical protein